MQGLDGNHRTLRHLRLGQHLALQHIAPCEPLLGSYNGNLYQVRRASDGMKDIGVLAPGGFANSVVQDSFCANTTCVISIIYDQSPQGNHLTKRRGADTTPTQQRSQCYCSQAHDRRHTVYGVHLPGIGYRRNNTSGIATRSQPETEYMVTSGNYYNAGCCFDYGNAETNNNDDGARSMISTATAPVGDVAAPIAGSHGRPRERPICWTEQPSREQQQPGHPFTSRRCKGRSGSFALKGGNAQAGS